jgi:CheY-like chemotaxis protein
VPTVLIAEDSPTFRGPVAGYLRAHGYDVVCAADGEEALRLLRERPDVGLVLLDLLTPKFDGADVLAAIRSDPSTRGLPVIAATTIDSALQREAMRSDVQWWVVKSAVSLSQLLNLLRKFLPTGAGR